MKYIKKQRHSTTCGPTALANVYKTFNRSMSYKRAIKVCGGMRKFKYRGMTIEELYHVFKRKGFDVVLAELPWKEAKWFASFENISVVMAYGWRKHGVVGGHFTLVDSKGRLINNGGRKNIRKYYKDSKKYWGSPPIFLIVKNKSSRRAAHYVRALP